MIEIEEFLHELLTQQKATIDPEHLRSTQMSEMLTARNLIDRYEAQQALKYGNLTQTELIAQLARYRNKSFLTLRTCLKTSPKELLNLLDGDAAAVSCYQFDALYDYLDAAILISAFTLISFKDQTFQELNYFKTLKKAREHLVFYHDVTEHLFDKLLGKTNLELVR